MFTMSTRERNQEEIWGSRALFRVLLGIFCFGLFLVISNPSKYQMDEHFYTDSAIRMVQTGDYWTPYFADGTIRLLKPILTYWEAAIAFKLFGINQVASRLPFLLASALAVCLTYQLSKTIFNCRRSALLAAMIIASNLQMMILSTRSTPDALVCLFVLISMWGFARVWFQGDKTFLGPLFAFGGLGLAVESKGLLGMAPLAAAVLFCLVTKPEKERTRRLLNWKAILIGLCLGLSWYAIMMRLHGLSSLRDFFDDQAGKKVTISPWLILRNLRDYVWTVFRYFTPWTILVLIAMYWKRRELAGLWKKNKSAYIFLTVLTGILIVFFCFGNIRKSRYLNTSFPMLAVLVASAIPSLLANATYEKWSRRVLVGFAILFALMGTVMAATGLVCSWQLTAGGLIFLSLAVFGFFAMRPTDQMWRCTWIAGALFSAFVVFGAFVQPAFSPSPLPLAADTLLRLNRDAAPVFTWQITDSDAGQLRLLAGGTLAINKLNMVADGPELPTTGIVVTNPQHLQPFKTAGFELQEIRATSTVLVAFPKLAELIKQNATKTCWIAIPPMETKSESLQ